MISDNKIRKLIDNHLSCELDSPDHNNVTEEREKIKL